MSAAAPLGYAARAGNYIRQSGREPDEHRMLADQVTPRQRRRMFRKERRRWPAVHADVAFDFDYGDDDLDGYRPDIDPRELSYCVTPGCNCCDYE